MKPVEGLEAAKPPACRFCEGRGTDAAESDGLCGECCGLGVDSADWWWEIAFLRNQLAQIRAVSDMHAEGEGSLTGTCVFDLEPWPCAGFIEEMSKRDVIEFPG